MKNIVLGLFFFVSCSVEETKKELIIGNWTSLPIRNIEDFSKSSYYTYGVDSTFSAFFGDYSHEGIYFIEDSKLIEVYPNGDTSSCTILELNDSILSMRNQVNDFEFTLYRFHSHWALNGDTIRIPASNRTNW